MTKVLRLSTAGQQAASNAIVDLIDADAGAGTLKIYSGTQPASANDAVAGTLLAELTFTTTAFGSADSAGTAASATITGDTSANATGTASWARIEDNSGDNVFDCNVGEAADTPFITLDNKSIVSGGTVNVTAFSITMPSGA